MSRNRLVTGLALFLLCALSVIRGTAPPAPVAATAPATEFSAERALRHVEQIAVRPHAMGMPDHDRVRDYVLAQLTALGLRPQVQTTTGVGTRYQAAGRVQNILAWLPGSDSKGKAVLLMAHYDGVEAGPAAGDDASGSAAMLETMRALKARPTPLAHDVIALFTDGEETGLIGAAAFVREHPWAKDVAVVLNFDARGTAGRAFMFETGPGNRDAASVLRAVGHATAGSVFTTVYRTLPNDTDLSELAVLGLPALNFAFAEGVERYHTGHDDLAHLAPGSVQHFGDEMLGLAKEFASGPLPRPATRDAVFFDFPLLGLVVYPEAFAIPLALIVCVLVGIVVFRDRAGVVAGVAATLVAVVLAAVVALGVSSLMAAIHARLPWGGDPMWRATAGACVALASVAATLLVRSAFARWTRERGAFAGALVVWTLVALALSIVAPGASYLFVWPAGLAAAALLATKWVRTVEWIAAIVTLLLIASFAYGVSVIMLGVAGAGAVALGLLASLVTLILLPHVDRLTEGAKWAGAHWVAGAAGLIFVFDAFATRADAAHPVPSALVYAENADSADAWFGTFPGFTDAWSKRAVAPVSQPPAWTTRLSGARGLVGHAVARVPLDAPTAVVARDTLLGSARRLVLRVRAPQGTTSLLMRVTGAPVLSSTIDGRLVDTTRYRRHLAEWTMPYWAVPDTGAIVALSLPANAKIGLELVSRRPGLPTVPGLSVPARPADVVPIQVGDATYVYRRLAF
ncbi:MAG: M28 family peptidase [Gemmatimonadaceae bacterium]